VEYLTSIKLNIPHLFFPSRLAADYPYLTRSLFFGIYDGVDYL